MGALIIMIISRFPAHDELRTCEASLIPPEQSVLSILESNVGAHSMAQCPTQSACKSYFYAAGVTG